MAETKTWKASIGQSYPAEHPLIFSTAGTYVDRNIEVEVPAAVVRSADTPASMNLGVMTPRLKTSGDLYEFTKQETITSNVIIGTKGFTDDTSYVVDSGQPSVISGELPVVGLGVSAPASATISVGVGTKASGKYPFTGTKAISGTATASVTSAGYGTNETATASITGSAGVTGSMNAIGLGITDPKNINGTITSVTVGAKSGSNYTITGSAATSGTVTAKVNSTGYGVAGVETGSGTVSGTASLNATIKASSIGVSSTDPGTGYTNNTSAIVPTGGYLKIEEGWIPATKISLATLVPEGAEDNPAPAAYIRNGYMAYDHNGALITGTMPDGGLTQGGSNPSQVLSAGGIYTIAAGYYDAPIVVKAQDAGSTDSAVLAASGTGSATVSSISFGTKSSGKYAVSGSGNISGTASATVTTAGYAAGDLTGSGSVTGTASVSTSVNAIGLSASGTASASSTGVALTPSGSYGSYTFSKNATISGTATASVTSDGYGKTGVESGTGSISGTATISGTIASGKISGALHTDSSKASGYDVYRVNGNTAGWLPSSSTATNACVDIPVYQGLYTVG